MSDAGERASRRSLGLLTLGAAAGLGCAAWGLLASGPGAPLPSGAVARVNGELVLEEEYRRLLAALASDRRDPLDEADRRHVLDRLIDEELLVQRGLELGLPRYDRRVRADLTSAVIASVVAEAESEPPSPAEVREFYDEEREFFTRPGRIFARQVFVRPGDGAAARAAQASARLRGGEPFASVAEDLGDAPVADLPQAPLSPAKLRQYVGPTAARTALELEPGNVSEPVRSGTGYHVLQVLEREPPRVPPLAEIESEVRAELQRRRGERALRAYLDDLRRRADLRVAARFESP